MTKANETQVPTVVTVSGPPPRKRRGGGKWLTIAESAVASPGTWSMVALETDSLASSCATSLRGYGLNVTRRTNGEAVEGSQHEVYFVLETDDDEEQDEG